MVDKQKDAHRLQRRYRRRRKDAAIGWALLLAFVALLALHVTPVEAQERGQAGADGEGQSATEALSLTPQEAYEHAIHLLRTTLDNSKGEAARKDGKTSASHKSSTSQRTSQKKQRTATTPSADKSPYQQKQRLSGVALYWELFRNWLPFTGIVRDLARLRSMLTAFFVDTAAAAVGEQQKLTASFRSNPRTWEGADILAPAEGFAPGTDPAEQEQARMYAGARPAPLWPEWDGGDDAYFGPFLSSTHDKIYIEEAAPILSKAGFSSTSEAAKSPESGESVQSKAWERLSIPGSQARKRKALQQRQTADQKRQEAVALLTWAAGWGGGDKEASTILLSSPEEHQDFIAQTGLVDWTDEVRRLSSWPYSDASFGESYILGFLDNASNSSAVRPNPDALWTLAMHSLWGTHGAAPQPMRAKACLERLVALNGNASAHNLLGWMEGGAWEKEGWALLDVDVVEEQVPDRQAKALMHYTAAAKAGDNVAQMTLAYRHHAGIGVLNGCGASLYWYEKAARDAVARFRSGPPGGLTLPYTHLRLSDISGGVFGPGSSAASTGWAKRRPAIQAMLHSLPSDGNSDGRRLEDLLEFFAYHAQRGEPYYALRLARFYYFGSVLGPSESAARVGRDYKKARGYFLRATKEVWPVDAANVFRGGPSGPVAAKGQKGEDVQLKVDDGYLPIARAAAGFLGRIYLRGEGLAQRDLARAWVWFQRGADLGDVESFNGLGVMFQQGLGVKRDMKKAVEYFDMASSAGVYSSAEGCVNMGRIHFQMNDYTQAAKFFDLAVKLGDSFEAYYYLALINVRMGRFEVDKANPFAYRVDAPGTASYERCRNAVSGYKFAVERADWKDPTFSRAERAWGKGLRGRALLGWSIAGERGYEAAQNNVAWVLDRDKKKLRIEALDAPQSNATDRLALIHWIRSAAQDNVDALVKMGDYYYYGLGVSAGDKDKLSDASAENQGPSPSSTRTANAKTSPSVSYEKAAACYSAAAERQTSALAYWNMGFMYERGLGVPKKDYNMAKRYYDMALELNKEAYLPVLLSLAKLFIMACWDAVTKKDASALNLLNGLAFGPTGRARILGVVSGGFWDNGDLPYTEADEQRILREREDAEAAAAMAGDDGLGDPNLPETYAYAGGRRGGEQRAGAGDEAGAALEGTEDLDSTIEGLLIVFGLAALAMLVYVRQGVQLRLERQRREQQPLAPATTDDGQEGSNQTRRAANASSSTGRPPEVDPNQPFGWPLQDGNAYAGL